MSERWKRVTRDLIRQIEEIEAALAKDPAPKDLEELLFRKYSLEKRMRLMLKIGAGLLGENPEQAKMMHDAPETR